MSTNAIDTLLGHVQKAATEGSYWLTLDMVIKANVEVEQLRSAAKIHEVYACFEFNDVDAPILRAIKTNANAQKWLKENYEQRFIVGFTVDHVARPMRPDDLFEWAAQNVNA